MFFVVVVPFKNVCFFCYLPYLTLGGELVICLLMTGSLFLSSLNVFGLSVLQRVLERMWRN